MRALRPAVELLVALPGVALLAFAAYADQRWFDRHCVHPFYLWPPNWYLPALRTALVGGGALFVFVLRPWAGRAAERLGLSGTLAATARIGIAAVLAVGASELVLRGFDKEDKDTPHPRLETHLGKPDPRLGWIFVPHRTTDVQLSSKLPRIRYAVDAHGDRARSADWLEDPARPTIVLTGESVAVGHGLEWPDTIAAQLETLTGAQVVVAAVGGYASDQAHLRALDTLARLQHPIAVVSIFVPVMLSRTVQDYRPRLVLSEGGGLVPAPPARNGSRLRNLVVNELRYMSEEKLQRAFAVTRAIHEATARAAAARGAKMLFVVPSYGPRRAAAEHPEAWIVRATLEGLPHVVVDLALERLMPHDGHPDPQGAREIAQAIAEGIRF
jgi:hypothetical protein